MGHYDLYKRQVLEYCQQLAHKGYLIGTGGNLSVRVEGEETIAITPSSRDYLTLALDDICVIGWDLRRIEGELPPSIETAAHIAVYTNRADANAVIHTHQPYASLFTLINRPIPALFDEQVANLGSCVELVPYSISGSPEMTQHITAALGNQCNAYLLQNHGALVLGMTMAQAALNVELLEKLARVYYYALTTGQPVTPLDPGSEQLLFELLKGEQRKEVRRKRKLLAAREKYSVSSQ
jgi:L-ribulose-5-phosphate 4-epimerase